MMLSGPPGAPWNPKNQDLTPVPQPPAMIPSTPSPAASTHGDQADDRDPSMPDHSEALYGFERFADLLYATEKIGPSMALTLTFCPLFSIVIGATMHITHDR